MGPGRPRKQGDTEGLVVKLAQGKEWGCKHTAGELKKLGHKVSQATQEAERPSAARNSLSHRLSFHRGDPAKGGTRTKGELMAAVPRTRIALEHGRWLINGQPTNPCTSAEGLLMNVRMVNAVFEDGAKHPEFNPNSNTAQFIALLPDYAAHGVNAFTICLQGGMPGY